MRLLKFAAALPLLFPAAAFAGTRTDQVYDAVTGVEMVRIMQEIGLPTDLGTDSYDDPIIYSTYGTINFFVEFYECDDTGPGEACGALQGKAIFSGFAASLAQLNVWNDTMRYAAAAIEESGDIELTMSFKVNGGATDDLIANDIYQWLSVLEQFDSYLRTGYLGT